MCKDNETHNCENNNTDHSGKDSTSPDQEQNTQKGELPENFDYNSITNFFVGKINKIILDGTNKEGDKIENKEGDPLITKPNDSNCKFINDIDYLLSKDKTRKIIGNISFILAIALAIIPMINCDAAKKYAFLTSLIIYGILFFGMYRLDYKLQNNVKINFSHIFDKLSYEQRKFLAQEKINDELIDYLRQGLSDIEKYVLGIIGAIFSLISFYSGLEFFENAFGVFSYSMMIIGFAILGIAYYSKSYNRTMFLNLLEHIKIDKIKKRYDNSQDNQ